MISLYNQNGAAIGGFEVDNRSLERELNLPPVLSFEIYKDLAGPFALDGLIKCDVGDYIIKEKKKSGENYGFVCKPDFSGLQADLITRAFITVTAAVMLADVLNGTGWTYEVTGAIQRTATITEATRYDSIYKIADAFNYEIYFDIAAKKIIMAETIGAALGRVYIHDEVNLINLNLSADSYDVYTRIIPRGKDGIGIESVNGGVPYLDNLQYTNRIKPFIWEDGRYTDLVTLKSDAAAILDDISKPRQAYEIDVLNLYRLDSEQWGFLEYKTGDFVDLVSSNDSVDTAQRILKTLTYLDRAGDMDTVTIANLNRDYTRDKAAETETIRQATETVRAQLKLLDDGIEARVTTYIQTALTTGDYATNSDVTGAITAQLEPLGELIGNNADAIAGVQDAITATDTQALKNLMATLEINHTGLNAKIDELELTETISTAQTANNAKYDYLAAVYTSIIAGGNVAPEDWTAYETALTEYKTTAAELERVLIVELNRATGLLDSEITDVKQLITADSIMQGVTTTQIWKDAISTIPTAAAIGAIVDTKIVTYDTAQTQTDAEFRREISKTVSDNAAIIEAKTRYFSETMAGFEIGLSGSPFTTLISNDKMSFKESGNTVSYIKYNQQVTGSVVAKTSLQMGEHKFESYAGNLTIARWVGPFVDV